MFTYPLKEECEKYEPLSKEDEKKYILLAQKGQRTAHEKVFNHNLRLLFKVVSKYKPDYALGGYDSHEDIEDLIIDLSMVLWHCIDKFDVSRNYRFSTYAHRAMFNKTITHANKIKAYKTRFISFSPEKSVNIFADV